MLRNDFADPARYDLHEMSQESMMCAQYHYHIVHRPSTFKNKSVNPAPSGLERKIFKSSVLVVCSSCCVACPPTCISSAASLLHPTTETVHLLPCSEVWFREDLELTYPIKLVLICRMVESAPYVPRACATATITSPMSFVMLPALPVIVKVICNASVRAVVVLLSSIEALPIFALASFIAPVVIRICTWIREADEVAVSLTIT